MSRVVIVLSSAKTRKQAAEWCNIARDGTRLEFKEPKRSVPQNDRMWAMLTDVAQMIDYHGVQLGVNDWKLLFLDALMRERKMELRLIPNLDGTGLIPLNGRSSSDLSREEMSDLIELINAYAATKGVILGGPENAP